MRAMSISADGWVQVIELDTDGHHRTRHPRTIALRHNLDLWYTDETVDRDTEPNMAAMGLALAASDHAPQDLPLICGEAIVVGIDPTTTAPASMTPQQYHALSYALLSSLAA